MVIHYSKYPILQFFDKTLLPGLDGKINIREEDFTAWSQDNEAIESARFFVKQMYSGYAASQSSHNTYILARPFIEALNRSAQAFRNISRGVELDKLFENCCIVIGNLAYVAYRVDDGPFRNDYQLSLYQTGEAENMEGNNIVYMGTLIFNKADDDHYQFDLALLSTAFEKPAIDYDETESIVDKFLGILIFKHYAKVELEVVNGKQRKKSDLLKDKIINSTTNNLKILDSQWYTSIFRKEGFSVRGHFRFYKSCNRLVYVNEYQKHGYHRHAKILDDPTSEPDTTELIKKLDELEKDGYIIQDVK